MSKFSSAPVSCWKIVVVEDCLESDKSFWELPSFTLSSPHLDLVERDSNTFGLIRPPTLPTHKSKSLSPALSPHSVVGSGKWNLGQEPFVFGGLMMISTCVVDFTENEGLELNETLYGSII